MEKIASFQVDHKSLMPGMYLSRVDKDIITYDIRFIKPNTPPFLDYAVIHTIEHLFAIYVRNSSFSEGIIYFGPMGCRTGFYFITRGISHKDAISLTKSGLSFIAEYSGPIPGSTEQECGNYSEHDLEGARKAASAQLEIMKNWNENSINYK
jgi:S-ribosylhomocysteine lyase